MMRQGLKWRVYGLVRPFVRPALLRVRTFFVGQLHDEVAALRHEVVRLRETVERQRAQSDAGADHRIETVVAQALATLALDRDR